MPKITFHSNRLYNNVSDKFHPVPAKKLFPKWFSDSDRYIKIPDTENYYINQDGGKMLNFKACPALMDFFTSGYFYTTPCDLTFYKNEAGEIQVKTESGFEDFCSRRDPMKDFVVPRGYHDIHFHWYPSWAPSLPKGYSAIYLSPVNRFDLPFITSAGIIDNDNMNTPGLFPFFLHKDFEGVIPSGTPYVQILPFKREDWEMDFKFYDYQDILDRHQDQANKYRTKDGGAYKKITWSKKKYE
jgi:hypothetical protein